MGEVEDSGFICPHCRIKYFGWPGDHICSDGTTHLERIHTAYRQVIKPEPGIYDVMVLTDEDRKWLKGMKIKI